MSRGEGIDTPTMGAEEVMIGMDDDKLLPGGDRMLDLQCKATMRVTVLSTSPAACGLRNRGCGPGSGAD